MAYNLISEIVRGNIQFPENSDAYAANGAFHAGINQTINLYTDTKQSSSGVRDEFLAVHQMEQDDDNVIQHVTKPENYPQLENWEDILNFRTVNQIQNTFHAPAFLPHKSHWKGLPDGPKQLSFGERFKPFFPILEAAFLTSSVWHILKGIGYLKDYHTFQTNKSEHEILCLQDSLKAAFELLECLPDKKTVINSQAWRYHPEKGGPSFIVNAKAYKICAIGPPKKNTNLPHPRVIATQTRIEALLLADNLNISFNDAVKHIKDNSLQGSSASENQEIQPEHLEEDSEELNGDPIQEQEQNHSEEESDYFNIESENSEDSEDL
ncbi:hypothetical protein M422DRAFT_268056 [Sphaerobolus stellatus SS14]|uniref:Uncharacterized protein n=1 Tax=Sphaerobolus stellatus (strain SS14) TaxID=990650 RepID=A0A0C9UZ95_SPHS4|nr:hypothetical protein M422DRAFT_268056 [Sphaerobolus stellatus SS14]